MLDDHSATRASKSMLSLPKQASALCEVQTAGSRPSKGLRLSSREALSRTLRMIFSYVLLADS